MMYTLLATGHGLGEVNAVLEQGGVQDDGMVLSEAEQQLIVTRIDAYNQVIRDAAAARGERVHPVEVGQLLNDAMLNGIELGGFHFDRHWGRGNAFTLDGVHPGYTGHGLIANEMISAINGALGISAPAHDLEAIIATDPYVDRDGDGWVPGPAEASPSGIAALLFLFTDPDDSNAAVGITLPADVWEQISAALLKELLGIEAVRAQAQRLGIAP